MIPATMIVDDISRNYIISDRKGVENFIGECKLKFQYVREHVIINPTSRRKPSSKESGGYISFVRFRSLILKILVVRYDLFFFARK